MVTDPLGEHIELPENVRVYLIAGTQHGGGDGVHAATPNRGICQNLDNPLALAQARLALSVALHEWVAKGIEPPPSRFPTIANDGLVQAAVADVPDIPGVRYSGSYNPLHLHDHGFVPPTQGDPYTVLVGKVDADGNMTEGMRHPNLAAPIGTHTGWNLRREGFAEGRTMRRDRIVHPVRDRPRGAPGIGRPTPLARGAVSESQGVRVRGVRRRRRPRAGSAATPTGRG